MPYTENWDGLNSSWGKMFIDSILVISFFPFDKVFVQWFLCMNSILLIFILKTREIVGWILFTNKPGTKGDKNKTILV